MKLLIIPKTSNQSKKLVILFHMGKTIYAFLKF